MVMVKKIRLNVGVKNGRWDLFNKTVKAMKMKDG